MSEESVEKVYRIRCPDVGCSWSSRRFDDFTGELASKVDASLHYVEEHGGKIPERADFGEHQCPECFDILGLDGTASCSECGYIPEEKRLISDGGRAEHDSATPHADCEGWSEAACKKALEDCTEELGESPSRPQYDKWRDGVRPSRDAIARRFGGWNAAKEAAGLRTYKKGWQSW